MPVAAAQNIPLPSLVRPQGPAARTAANQEPLPAYTGPYGIPGAVPITPRQIEYAGMLRALKVPAVINNHARLEQIGDILQGHGITARDVYEVLRDLDHTAEVPSPGRLPSPAFMRKAMAAMLEIRLNLTRAQALDKVDKGRAADIGAIAALIGTEVVIGGLGAIEGAGALYVFGCAKAGYAANMAFLKTAGAAATGAAKGKAAVLVFGWAGVGVVASLWAAKVCIVTPVQMLAEWHMSHEALFTQRSKDAAIVSHVVDGVVFREAPRGYYDHHPAQ